MCQAARPMHTMRACQANYEITGTDLATNQCNSHLYIHVHAHTHNIYKLLYIYLAGYMYQKTNSKVDNLITST